MRLKKQILVCVIALAMLTVFITPSAIGGDDSVTITVRIKQVGVEVYQSTWAIGWVSLSSTSTTSNDANWTSCNNTGNYAEHFYANSSDTNSRTLADTAGDEIFGLSIQTNESGDVATWTAFDNSSWNQTIGTDIPAGEGINFGLKFYSPTATTSTEQENVTLTLTAVLA